MKVAFLFDDDTLTQSIREHPLFQEQFTFYRNPETCKDALEKESYDAIVLSDRYFPFSAMCEYIEHLKEKSGSSKIILMLSNQHDANLFEQYKKYCLANQIQYIHPGQSTARVAEKLVQCIYGAVHSTQNRNNVVLFLGTTPNIGTTVVSFGTAVLIASQTQQSVGYICLNLKSSKIHRYLGLDHPVISLNSMRAEMKSKSLNRERLFQYSYAPKEIPHLHILFGNLMREQAEFYTVEDLHYLLEECSKAFDLCLVEVSAYWDNAATICGLLRADTKIVVSTDQLAHFQEDAHRWMKSLSPMFDLDYRTFDLFITQKIRRASSHGFRMKDIRNETGMNLVGQMGWYEEVSEYLNQGKILELTLYHERFAADCSGLANMLMGLYHIEKKQDRKQLPWIYRWIGGHVKA